MNRTTKVVAAAIAVAAAGAVAGATAGVAAGKPKAGIARTTVDKQLILWRTGRHNRPYTTSEKWASLDMPTGGCVVGQPSCSGQSPAAFMVFAKGPISLTFSGVFSRAPVELRFRDGRRIMAPGAIHFRPQRGDKSFSFTFVSPRTGKRACEGPTLQWRSPTGDEVRLDKATIVVHYKKYVPQRPVGCA